MPPGSRSCKPRTLPLWKMEKQMENRDAQLKEKDDYFKALEDHNKVLMREVVLWRRNEELQLEAHANKRLEGAKDDYIKALEDHTKVLKRVVMLQRQNQELEHWSWKRM